MIQTADFKKLYYRLAGKLADVIETLDKLSADLKKIQQDMEEVYISSDETTVKLIDNLEEPNDSE